jgi:hypothetical protein
MNGRGVFTAYEPQFNRRVADSPREPRLAGHLRGIKKRCDDVLTRFSLSREHRQAIVRSLTEPVVLESGLTGLQHQLKIILQQAGMNPREHDAVIQMLRYDAGLSVPWTVKES